MSTQMRPGLPIATDWKQNIGWEKTAGHGAAGGRPGKARDAAIDSEGGIKFSSGRQLSPTKDYGDLEKDHSRLEELMNWAERDDREELEIAASELKGYCSSGWDANGTWKVFNDLVGQMHAAWQAFDKQYGEIIKTKENPKTLIDTTYKEWGGVISELDQVEKRIPQLGIDNWQGQAAQNYRQGLPSRAQDVQQTKALAVSSQNGIEAVAELQAIILTGLQSTMQAVLKPHAEDFYEEKKLTPERRSQLHEHFKNSYWDFKINNQNQYGYKFFVRTKVLAYYFNWLNEQVRDRLTNTDNGVWVPSSQDVNEYLETAVQQTKSGGTADNSQYTQPDVDAGARDDPNASGVNGENMRH